ncbi:EF-Hand 1, calcium-binding site [Phytophthora cactorum]|nr:EF-Hand 1, calcium-binding site [Phytophthora cactorum]
MSSPKFLSVAPTQLKVLPFASSTDSTLHRPAWRSTRAIDLLREIRSPSRFRGQLRYDLLGPLQPSTPTSVESKITSTSESPETLSNDTILEPESLSPTQPTVTLTKDAATAVASVASGEVIVKSGDAAVTNIEELRWFQHRWLDKHGRNSNLKTTREQLALMRRWFDSLDADGSGEVGLDELEDPLVSVGLAGRGGFNGTGSVTFDAFLNLFYPERVKRERSRRFPPPLHTPKHRPPLRPKVSPGTSGASFKAKRSRQVKTNAGNPVARLFENLQAGKLGDLAVPFPVLITAYRRRMLLDAHMADNPAAKRVGSSVLQALETSKREISSPETYDWRKTHVDLHLPTLT